MSWHDLKSCNILALPLAIRKQICFLRVWCLVEAHQACSMEDMPILYKCGSHLRLPDGSVEFKPDWQMLENLKMLVNVMKAEATVESDKERILRSIANGAGLDALNRVIRGAIQGARCAAGLGPSSSAVPTTSHCLLSFPLF